MMVGTERLDRYRALNWSAYPMMEVGMMNPIVGLSFGTISSFLILALWVIPEDQTDFYFHDAFALPI